MKRSVAHEEESMKQKEKVPIAFSTSATSWKRDFEKNLKSSSALPTVIESDFQDAEKLFETKMAKVTLRKPTSFCFRNEIPDNIVLLQFDPNFKSNEVICRHPSCKYKNPRAGKCSKGVKRDLYLCPNHREPLKERICQVMEKANLRFPRSAFISEPGRFEGYTSLIGRLEGAYHEARKVPTSRSTSQIVEEAILNARNFLIITNTVLNPENDNLALALAPFFFIFQRILENQKSPENILQKLISALKEVVDLILFAFGINYIWVLLANPGAQIGIGVGVLFGGFVGAVGFALGPATGVAALVLGATVGGISGGFLGSGIQKRTEERSVQQVQQRIAENRQEWVQPVKYNFNGDGNGELVMSLMEDATCRQ